MSAFCEWPVDYLTCEDEPVLAGLSPEDKAAFERMAGEYLWRWTNKRFGLCSATIRPCRQDCTVGLSTYGGSGTSLWTPALVGGTWINLGCASGCGDRCGCVAGSELHFSIPVDSIVAVEVDGVTLPPTSYRLDNHRILVRTDGGTWPYCQDMSAPLGDPDTWAVEVNVGAPVPIGGQYAAAKLVIELAKGACGDKNCELPQRWQSITRQGVSISAALDLFEGLEEGKTGIWVVDSWVASVVKPLTGFSLASPDHRPVGRRSS